MKKVIAAAVLALFLVPALAAAYTYSPSDYPRAREMLVEGHTVFSVISADICIDDDPQSPTYGEAIDCPDDRRFDADLEYDVRANVTIQRLGTAVAVLVRDRVKEVPPAPYPSDCPGGGSAVVDIWYENPGVLWFNDQFLVGDDLDILEVETDANVDVCVKVQDIETVFENIDYRYPCGGWVFATQAGNPDPRGLLPFFQYEESYLITDPNDHVWTIDKYGLVPLGANFEPVFATIDPAQGGHGVGNVRDVSIAPWNTAPDPTGSGPAGDSPHWMYYIGALNMWSVPILGYGTVDPGPTSGISCPAHADLAPRDPAYPNGQVSYNAVLFFFFEDLIVGTTLPGIKQHGVGGLHDGDYSFCEQDDFADCPGGSDNAEGNSHPYNDQSGDSGPVHFHPTANVDLYFSNEAPPAIAARQYAVVDTTGSGAIRHTHDPTIGFDDRIDIDPCADVDFNAEYAKLYFNGGGTYTEQEYRDNYEAGNPYASSGQYVESGEYARYGEGQQMDGSNDDDCTY